MNHDGPLIIDGTGWPWWRRWSVFTLAKFRHPRRWVTIIDLPEFSPEKRARMAEDIERMLAKDFR